MSISPKDIVNQIIEFWNNQNKKRKIIIVSSLTGIICLALIITLIINSTNYAVLYSGLSDAEGAEIVKRLDELSIQSKIENNGTILVPSQDIARLKMQLSGEGYPKSALSYDVFTDNISFTSTDFEKKQYLVYQLQNRMQDSIKTIEGVESAIVTISLTNDSDFVLKEDVIPTTASVILKLKSGVTLSSKQIKGIENLVSKSIPGLNNENVTIVDSTGTTLNSGDITEDGTNLTKIELENKASSIIEQRIVDLLKPVFGKNGLSVAVNVVIDFQKVNKEIVNYTPVVGDKGVISSEDIDISTDGAKNAAGTPGVDRNSEDGTDNDNELEDGVINKSSSIEYLVNKLIEQIQQDSGAIKDLSAAVMVDEKDLSDHEKATIQEMVAMAAGIDNSKVVVSNMEFTAARKEFEKLQDVLNKNTSIFSNKFILIAAAVFAIIFLILLIVLIATRRKKKEVTEAEYEEIDNLPHINNPAINNTEPMPDAIVLNQTREQVLKKQIRDFTTSNPELVAQLLRTWIEEDN